MQKTAPGRRKTFEAQRQAVEKISTTTDQSQETLAPDQQLMTGQIFRQLRQDPRSLSPNSVLQLQRTLGNQTVRRLLAKPAARAHHTPHAARVMRQTAWGSNRAQPGSAAVVQRRVRPLQGKSSGWFRKGRRDKINLMVTAYNTMEMKHVGTKKSVAGYQLLIAELDKIWQAANQWKLAVLKKAPDKAEEIQAWMDKEVVGDRELKQIGIAEMQQTDL